MELDEIEIWMEMSNDDVTLMMDQNNNNTNEPIWEVEICKEVEQETFESKNEKGM